MASSQAIAHPHRHWGQSWPPIVIAERGASLYAPENSLLAFRNAVSDGADAIAMDVMRCGTGEVVVFHEHTLAKFGGGRWDDVATTPLATLSKIDLGRDQTIPLLSEALDATAPDVLLNFRLRPAPDRTDEDYAELAMLVMMIATRAGAAERVLISASEGAVLAPFGALGVATAVVVPSMPLRVVGVAQRDPSVVQLELHGADAAAVRRWHARDAAVHLFPANTASQLAIARGLRVAGVLTNDPAGAR